jgi:predicted outer membrane lipoprotein
VKVFAWPLAYALACALGLVCALLGDGVWDGVSWLALAAPLVPVVRTLTGRRACRARPVRP